MSRARPRAGVASIGAGDGVLTPTPDRWYTRAFEANTMVTLFTVGEETNHHVGERGCPMCREPYPAACQCGGLMHAGVGGPEDADGNIMLITRCDRCGRSEEQLEEP